MGDFKQWSAEEVAIWAHHHQIPFYFLDTILAKGISGEELLLYPPIRHPVVWRTRSFRMSSLSPTSTTAARFSTVSLPSRARAPTSRCFGPSVLFPVYKPCEKRCTDCRDGKTCRRTSSSTASPETCTKSSSSPCPAPTARPASAPTSPAVDSPSSPSFSKAAVSIAVD